MNNLQAKQFVQFNRQELRYISGMYLFLNADTLESIYEDLQVKDYILNAKMYWAFILVLLQRAQEESDASGGKSCPTGGKWNRDHNMIQNRIPRSVRGCDSSKNPNKPWGPGYVEFLFDSDKNNRDFFDEIRVLIDELKNGTEIPSEWWG